MKTIEEFAREWIENESITKDTYEVERSIKAALAFAQRWIPIEEELPENIKIIAELSGGAYMVANMATGLLAKDQVKYFGITRWRPLEYK